MASLKDLKTRIKSVKSTQKITQAMKVVAAAKLRRAREQAEEGRPYALALEHMVEALAASLHNQPDAPALLAGNGRDHTHLILVATSDRGLCGAFNGSIVRATRRKIRELTGQGKEVKLLFVGRKGFELLQHDYARRILGKPYELARKVGYADANTIAASLIEQFNAGEFDVAHVMFNTFKSAISQIVTFQQVIPLPVAADNQQYQDDTTVYDYEPSEAKILTELLPKNLSVQIYRALLENTASFYGAQMTAMDNASRNAGDMIKRLNLVYNRTRQAAITKELIEIISGAEAV